MNLDKTVKRIIFEDKLSKLAKDGSEKIITMIQKGKIDINERVRKGPTLLHLVCVGDNEKNKNLFNYLLHNGADINAKDRNGLTPIFYALVNKNIEFFRILLQDYVCEYDERLYYYTGSLVNSKSKYDNKTQKERDDNLDFHMKVSNLLKIRRNMNKKECSIPITLRYREIKNNYDI
ncbi:Ankyrin-repeat protein [Orpheovirus IHUMI-LCC2]|uniref:Ankyrin-repeat protein n=1 Tax=Orpheovirus IHUMI-LCC2 TaxID=2023057 RepID=A0A2I2L3L1_9VIRU|nr:Ankyrin-repeat protein [Orpheovirus IHUMI-LCC2]SNW62059.1 Ankyrin-repeat protein [Orpheovirus IHUMI-LCC2]